ncbi:tyrosine-type recombinase/integrase [Anaeromassilibacillus senegalensis]|uniref:tyrosine-type recombinase/integrase n=1 Tax=Anaeromassilibacillus senegalensis TaxID=1673717 RepID=UPI00067FEBD4|nr:site-specific integrase [Anaeromassilibacillus senegalensis]
MPRKGENIYKRKDGRWEGRYLVGYAENGKAKYRSIYGKTYSEVKSALKKASLVVDQPQHTHSLTVSDLFVLWLRAIRITVKASTFSQYTFLVNQHILPGLGSIRLDMITADRLDRFVEQKIASGRIDKSGGLSPKTISDILYLLKSALDYGEKQHLCLSPYYNLSVKPKVTVKEVTVLSSEERQILENFLLNNLNYQTVGILLALYTGLRLGELCALKWENISFVSGILMVRGTLQRIHNEDPNAKTKTSVILDTPKSQSSIRDIPLPAFLENILFDLSKEVSPQAFILTGKEGRYLEPRTYQNYFKRYLKAAGLKSYNFHVLRHTFATRCVESKFDVKSLSELLGHANVNTTMNRYVHPSMDLKRRYMDGLKPA